MHAIIAMAPIVARAVFGLVFVITAIGLTADFTKVTALMSAKRVPFPQLLLGATILVWVICGGGLASGLAPAPSALSIAAMLVPITIGMHDFWRAPSHERENERQHFMANAAIIAGLIYIGVSELMARAAPFN
jgi:putative oxidoreductase